jgi:signal transduction histidine kinase
MSRIQSSETAQDPRLAALEARLADAERELAELRDRQALDTRFLANISHDLRTPLTAIITHAEIIRDEILGEINERQKESLTGVISAGRQLLDMVAEILTHARAAAHRIPLEITQFTVDDLIEQVCALNEPLVAKKGHDLKLDVEDQLPMMWADREKVAHIISNLLGNAMQFTPNNGRVWLTARRAVGERGQMLMVEVGDSGIGIAPEHHELIFREFAQVDSSAAREHHGTGLGLSIARKFVELHGGRIWLESAPGRGSRVFFTLPFGSGAGA